MIQVKIYEYNSANESNEYKGTDYSSYVQEAGRFGDNLDDTIAEYELTLVGLSTRQEFAPSSMFIIELWQDDTRIKTYNVAVDNDTVSQPILNDNTYFNHTITFSELATNAQQRVVDNISVTYKLQDVSLDVVPSYDTGVKCVPNKNAVGISAHTYDKPFGRYEIVGNNTEIGYATSHAFEWYIPTDVGSFDDWEIAQNQTVAYGSTSKTITLPIPLLKCKYGINGGRGYSLNGYCSVDVVVERKLVSTSSGGEYEEVERQTFNPATAWDEGSWTNDDTLSTISYPTITGNGKYIFSEYRMIRATEQSGDNGYRCVAIPTRMVDSYVTDEEPSITIRKKTITIEKDYRYRISVVPKQFDENFEIWYPDTTGRKLASGYNKLPMYFSKTSIIGEIAQPNENYQANYDLLSYSIEFNVFELDKTGEIIFKSSNPANAYDLFNKAVLASENFRKTNGVVCEETSKPFYVNENDKQILKNTQIIENFYQQKNLWEIFMEVGKYIHARPLVKFGTDNRFEVNWRKYGITDQRTDVSNKVSVFNSRFVSEYISSLSSYVDNMVQLGGTITEIVAPKSSSEDFLVYNDVAEIKVSRPITEIVGFYAINNNAIGDIEAGTQKNLLNLQPPTTAAASANLKMGAIYEYNVYKLLSVEKQGEGTSIKPKYYPNKGFALYYNLGENTIKGLNYTLPTIEASGERFSQYAIKNILGLAYGLITSDTYSASSLSSLKVNDFRFKIIYRTKDVVRSDQTRPDLRKYLLGTKYDNVPQHYQFNNQQDTLVDSEKFGINTYGKLIRTGNTTFTEIEWNNNLNNIKNAGELYSIYNNLYYVSKVTHTVYSDHIESNVEYSKDFNRLAQIIGIPSEPRFYEISEQSQIRREKTFNSYVMLTDSGSLTSDEPINSYINDTNSFTFVKNLLFGATTSFPKYAHTVFKNDGDKVYGSGTTHLVKTLSPISAYSTQNTLTFAWDMEDNFSAGDQVGDEKTITGATTDSAYRPLVPYQYPDIYGRTDLVDFAIISDYTPTASQVRDLPQSPFDDLDDMVDSDNNSIVMFHTPSEDINSHYEGEILLKDNREAISLNANTQMLTGSDRFVLSSYLWQPNKGNMKMALLNTEVDKLSASTISNDIFTNAVKTDIAMPNISVITTNYINVNTTAIGSLLSPTIITKGNQIKNSFVLNAGEPSNISIENGKIKLANIGSYTIDKMGFTLGRSLSYLDSTLTISLVLEDENGTILSTLASGTSNNGVALDGIEIPKTSFTTSVANTYLALYCSCPSTSTDNFWGRILKHTNIVVQRTDDVFYQTLISIDIANRISGLSPALTDDQKTNVKSIVIYSPNTVGDNGSLSGAHYFVLGKNVGDLANANKFTNWVIATPTQSNFTKQ